MSTRASSIPFSPSRSRMSRRCRTAGRHPPAVHRRRQDRTRRQTEDRYAYLFSGYVWTGEQSMDLGLVDELGSANYVARDVIGQKRLSTTPRRKTWYEHFSKKLGTAFRIGRVCGEVSAALVASRLGARFARVKSAVNGAPRQRLRAWLCRPDSASLPGESEAGRSARLDPRPALTRTG